MQDKWFRASSGTSIRRQIRKRWEDFDNCIRFKVASALNQASA